MKGYKAFKRNLICNPTGKNPFQYTENTIFETDTTEPCKSGFHFCKNPLDVFNYYPLIDDNGNETEFAEVEALDEVKTDNNKKFCTKKLKVRTRIDFPTLMQASVNIGLEKVPTKNIKNQTASKNHTKISNNNDYAKISNNNDYAKISNSGYFAKISSSGSFVQISNSGNSTRIDSNNDCVQIGNSGDSVKISSSGDRVKIGSNSDFVKINSSGKVAQISNSGNYVRINSSGNAARISSNGDFVKISSSGNYARISSKGKNSIIYSMGYNSVAKGKIGNWITLSEWIYDKEKEAFIPICIKTEIVNGEKIKEDTFYKLENGNFIEVE